MSVTSSRLTRDIDRKEAAKLTGDQGIQDILAVLLNEVIDVAKDSTAMQSVNKTRPRTVAGTNHMAKCRS